MGLASHEELLNRQRTLAAFGEFVLRGGEDLQTILPEGCRLIADALGTDLAKILAIERGRGTAIVLAGVGWAPGVVGVVRIELNERSSESYALAAGEPVVTQDLATETRWRRRKDGSRAFIEGQNVALRGPDGILRGYMKIGQDTTERRRSQERQSIPLAELQHRVRNVLAMVRSVVSRGDGASVEEFRSLLEGRITAMARTQALLTRGAGAGVDLEDLIREELLTQLAHEDQVALSGPAIALAPKAAEVVTLAIHELATNALKYGPPGQGAGRLEVSWSSDREGDKDWLHLTWQERGVSLEVPVEPRVGSARAV